MPKESRPRPRPGYHSPLRTRQAAETRQLVLDAAISLYSERGWAGTTIAGLAAEAGTAIDTVYAAFGSKLNLLMVATDVAIVGDDEEAAMVERPEFVMLSKGRRIERLRAAVRIAAASFERSVPVLRALQEAAGNNEAARARLDQYEKDRWVVIATGLELVLGYQPPDDVIDGVWAIVSPETFVKLTVDRGWSIEDFERWLIQTTNAVVGSRAK